MATFDSRNPANQLFEEAQWIALAKEGDLDAYRWIYDRYRRRLYALAHRFCNDVEDADDAVQEAFLRVYRKIHTFRGTSAFGTWMYRVAVNVMIRYSQRQRKDHNEPIADVTDVAAAIDTEASIGPEDKIDLRAAISRLRPRQKAVLVLHAFEGKTHKEIGSILGISPGTSKAHLHRAKRLLKKDLEHDM